MIIVRVPGRCEALRVAANLADAACRWVRDITIRNTVGASYGRYRVKVYSPKGANMVDSGQFVCRNHGVELDLPAETPMPDLRIPAPTFEQAAMQGGVEGIKALGDYYAQWGQIVLGSVGQLQGVNNAMLGRLHRQLERDSVVVGTVRPGRSAGDGRRGT